MKISIAIICLVTSMSVMATPGGEPNHTGCNGVGNANSPCDGGNGNGGNSGGGGGGGNGGEGGHGGAGGNSGQQSQSQENVQIQGQSQSAHGGNSSQSQSLGQSQGNSQSASATVNQSFTSKAADLGRTVPTVVAPALTTTLTETCMGSMSMGLSVVGMGMSGGATYTDEECVRRLDSRQMHALGEQDLAREIMCDSPEVRAAAIRIGRPCQTDRVVVVEPPVVVLAATVPSSQCANPALTEGGRAACARRLGL